MSNSKNRFYSPKEEINYEVYEQQLNEPYTPSYLFTGDNESSVKEIIESIKSNEGYTIFKYEPSKTDEDGYVKLPQVPYEIKELSLKTLSYTFFLTFIGRLIGALKYFSGYTIYPFIPASVFMYQYSKAILMMTNAVTEIKLINNGTALRLYFKQFRKPVEVKIQDIIKKKEPTFFNECYTEPFLYPIQINRTNKYGKYSLRSHLTVYLYGDSHSCIKNGEILKAVIENSNIDVSQEFS